MKKISVDDSTWLEYTRAIEAGSISSGKPFCGRHELGWKTPCHCSNIRVYADWTFSDNAAREGEPMADDGIYPGMGQE